MHTVWGIYQMVMFDSSAYFRRNLKRHENATAENSTVANSTVATPTTTNSTAPAAAVSNNSTVPGANILSNVTNVTGEVHKSGGGDHFEFFKEIQKWIYPNGSLLKLTIIMWYVGIMLGVFVAGWFLIRVVQKKNIYVSYTYHHYYYSELFRIYVREISQQ